MLATWLSAQNDGDFAAYSALYGKAFLGIRRTSDGREKKMKLKAWKADRKKMFKKAMEVAADNPQVKTSETGATISFLQRWKSGSYADHGTKVLKLAYDKAGAMQIVREELLSSTPGWEDDPSTVLDATDMVGTISVWVQEEGIDPNEGCTSVTYVLYMKDKKRHTLSKELGGGFVPTDDSGRTTIAVPPGGDGLYEFGEWCAGGADYYQVKQSGDALIVLYKGVDEGEEKSQEFQTILTVQLPAGAKIKAK